MLEPKQQEFVDALLTAQYRYLQIGGSVSGGKSFVCIGIIHKMADDYPKTRYFICRKNYTTLKRTSIPTLRKVLEADGDYSKCEIKRDSAVYANGSEIIFLEADETKDPDWNKLKGGEYTAGLIEESNEIAYAAFNVLITRVGRWNVLKDGTKIPHFILLNCNPAKNWVKEKFYTPFKDGTIAPPWYFLPTLPTDNSHNSPEYLASLEDLPEAEKERYVRGNWDYGDDPNILIPYDWYRRNSVQEYEYDKTKRTILAIDPARYGDDKTIFCLLNGNVAFKYIEYSKMDTFEVAMLAIHTLQDYHILPQDCIVDAVGLGAGVVDAMKSKGYKPTAFIGGGSPVSNPDVFTFRNVRAEAYYFLREDFRADTLQTVPSTKLQKDIANTRYTVEEKVIKVEAKEDIKKRLGSSPDYGDALSMANYHRRSMTKKDPAFFVV
jgi:phage terminase large subunit